MPGGDKVDVLVVVAGAEVEATCSLGPGPILSGDRDAEGRGVWVASGENRVGQGDGIKEPIACLSHNARLPDFYVVVVDTATVGERLNLQHLRATALPPSKLSAPNQCQSRRWPDWRTLRCGEPRYCQVQHRVQATAKEVG